MGAIMENGGERGRQPRQSEGFNDYNFQEFRDDKHVKHNCAIEKETQPYTIYSIKYSIFFIAYVVFFLRKTARNF